MGHEISNERDMYSDPAEDGSATYSKTSRKTGDFFIHRCECKRNSAMSLLSQLWWWWLRRKRKTVEKKENEPPFGYSKYSLGPSPY
jgi:hypothetical protein